MRQILCSICLIVAAVLVTACGQSGALHLPSETNADQRASYLLYKNKKTQDQASSQQNSEDQATPAASQPSTTSP